LICPSLGLISLAAPASQYLVKTKRHIKKFLLSKYKCGIYGTAIEFAPGSMTGKHKNKLYSFSQIQNSIVPL